MEEDYPAFSSFRKLMTLWDQNLALQEAEKSIHDVLDRHGLILFFKKNDDIFGAPEDSRLIFAKLKNGDEDDPMTGFQDQAKFLGVNLIKAMFGTPEDSTETMFGQEDLPNINVCDRDEVVQMIINHKPEKKKGKKKK